MQVLWWLSLGILFYTFLGYPLLMFAWSSLRYGNRCYENPISYVPTVCVIVVVFNEEHRIAARIENLFLADYPAAKLRILVVSDGSTDTTPEIVNAISHPRLDLLERKARCGKATCLNAAILLTDAEVIVFADVRQRFDENTIPRLVRHFADPKVGAVSGALEIEPSTTNVGRGVDTYWRLEKQLRKAESRLDSAIGCTGAVYGIRRELFREIPADTVLDDVVIPMQISLSGARVLFDPAALAFDPQALNPTSEKVRKVRTLAGNFQMLFRHSRWLLPWRNRLWWQLISHKYLRLIAPLLLGLLFVINCMLLGKAVFQAMFITQALFYLLAGGSWLFPSIRSKVLTLPGGFVFLNLLTVRAFWSYLTKRDLQQWSSAPQELE